MTQGDRNTSGSDNISAGRAKQGRSGKHALTILLASLSAIVLIYAMIYIVFVS